MQAAEVLPAAGDRPLTDSELNALFAPLAGARKVALAVSGGSDSLALLDAADRWACTKGRPELLVLTVDHRIQPGSALMAATVTRVAEARGLPVRVLVREGELPEGNLEAAAREARYRLLLQACREAGATHLVTAHHRDDVAETFLMRMRRGAGLFGLAAMRGTIDLGNIVLVRPFLDVPRSRLRATAHAAGLAPAEDPMNSDPRFARTAARAILSAGHIDADVVAAVAGRLATVAQSIDAAATAFIAGAVVADDLGIAWLPVAAFGELDREARGRVLVRLLIAVGGGDYAPRREHLAGLAAAMTGSAPGQRFKRTLAGVVVERRRARFAIYRETGRDGLPVVALAPAGIATWDRRFVVAVGPDAPAGITVGPLGEEGRRVLGAAGLSALDAVPPAALAALPAIWNGREILALPRFRPGGAQLAARFEAIVGGRLLRAPLFPDLLPP